jgi:hypothetical protein
MYVFVLNGDTQSHTTQVHTSRYSRHLCHILESVGRHRRDTLRRKIQVTTLRGAGARAHERRTSVVAAEVAAAKGHCPRYGRARDGTLVPRQCAHLLDTDRRALQLVVGQIKLPVSRRNRKLGRQLSGILRKANKKINVFIYTHTKCMYVCMYDCLRSESESASHSSPPQQNSV